MGVKSRPPEDGRSHLLLSSSPLVSGHLVDNVREAVDHFAHGVMERTAEMKEAFDRSTGKVYHAITSNNRIVQFR